MMQSLKEFIVEFEWLEKAGFPEISNYVNERPTVWITPHSYVKKVKSGMELHIKPTHLSTYTQYDNMTINNNKIMIYGFNYHEEIPFGLTEETYFQQSLIIDISNIPLEFLVKCEETYNSVLYKFKKAYYD